MDSFFTFEKGDEIPAIDPDEFRAGCEYAIMVTENEFLEEIPGINTRFEIEEESYRLSNSSMNRYGLAAAKFFRGDRRKMQAFMYRTWGLPDILDDPKASDFVRRGESDAISMHPAIIEVASSFPLLAEDDIRFEIDGFMEEVKRVAAIMEDDEE